MNALFVCVANSGRSVMAQRLFERAAQGRHEARSAGSEPGTAPHPQVVAALREVGIEAVDHVPRRIDGRRRLLGVMTFARRAIGVSAAAAGLPRS